MGRVTALFEVWEHYVHVPHDGDDDRIHQILGERLLLMEYRRRDQQLQAVYVFPFLTHLSLESIVIDTAASFMMCSRIATAKF